MAIGRIGRGIHHNPIRVPPCRGAALACTDRQIQAAKPREKPYKLFDTRGLYLLITPDGSKLWRFRYRIEGREKLISLGDSRDVSLKRAREKRDEARSLVADGRDPSAQRKGERAALGTHL